MSAQEWIAIIAAVGGLVGAITAGAVVIIRALRQPPAPPTP